MGRFRFFILLTPLIFTGTLFAVVTRPEGWGSSLQGALDEAKRTGAPVLLDVYAPWCHFCEQLHNEVYPTSQFRTAAQPFIKVSINSDEFPELMHHYRISGTPTILFLNQDGGVVDRVAGFVRKETLSRILSDVLVKADEEKKLFALYEKNPDDPALNFQIGVHYTESGRRKEARDHFMRAWNSKQPASLPVRLDAIYNAAVTSMELKDYSHAISCWNSYLSLHRENDEDYAYARLYRGMAYRKLSLKRFAKEDLVFASKHLPTLRDRTTALRLLSELD